MKRLFGLVLAGLLVLGVLSAPAGADGTVKVWTQNLYLGADLTPVISPSDGGFEAAARKALEDMAANLFPLRAQRLATEVALYEPDLIALQEVEAISLNGNYPGPPFVDYLQSLQNALKLRGQHYKVAAVVDNLDLTVPINITGGDDPDSVRVVDRDVILIRKGVKLNNILNFNCAEQSSEQGCNYFAKADVPSPIGPISIVRGYVGVDVSVREKRVFFVTTHLEQRILSPDFLESALIQPAQAAELVLRLGFLPADAPLILAGDFNSSPQDLPFDFPPLPEPIVPPYLTISDSGFTDAWTKNPLALLDREGLTCCQDPKLDNRTSHLYERIDIVFVRNARFTPWELVTTRVPLITPAPHWASDHGGVFAKLVFK